MSRPLVFLTFASVACSFGMSPACCQETEPTDPAAASRPAGSSLGNTEVDEQEQQGGDSADVKDNSSGAKEGKDTDVSWALFTLAVGMAIVLGLIIVLKVNAFIALISAAMVVSLMAPGEWASKISRVPTAFGATAGGIGIVIALAAVIGKCMLDSGAADRVVRAFLGLLGEKRAPMALMGSGFVLAVPVFFDTVFYLLVPLARSMHRRTGVKYLTYILAIGAGGAITHTLVPPTPGPLVMADNLNFDVGWMIMIGALVAMPAAFAGLVVAGLADRIMKTPMRQIGTEPEPEPLDDSELPSLFLSLLPVVLPVLLISTNTILSTIADSEHAALLTEKDVQQWPEFRSELREEEKEKGANPAKRIFAILKADNPVNADERAGVVKLLMQETPLTDKQKKKVIDGLNRFVLANKSFHRGDDEDAFVGIMPNKTARGLLKKGRLRMKKPEVERMNRALLESAYPEFVGPHHWETAARKAADISAIPGNASLALLISTVIAMWTLVKTRGLSRGELAKAVEVSLMSGGVIILITSGGGAFGAMLTEAKVGEAIQSLFSVGGANSGMMYLGLGFLIAAVLKVAQGSSTVAMITGSAMLVSVATPETLGCHPVYLATSIGAGSLIGSWMNDSGFWIFAKMGGLTEAEALKSWTVMLIVLGLVSFGITLILSQVMPLV